MVREKNTFFNGEHNLKGEDKMDTNEIMVNETEGIATAGSGKAKVAAGRFDSSCRSSILQVYN